MVLKNLNKLAKTPLRADALAIIEAGYESINIESIFEDNLHFVGGTLHAGESSYDLADFDNVYVAAVGKGSGLAAKAIEQILGPKWIKAGYAIDIASRRLKKIKVMKGTHPLPSERNIKATDKIVKLLESAGEKDLVISVICGGGSALFSRPATLTALELQFVSSMLLRAGASIQEINTVRKHVSHIHGGYMATYAYPAHVVSFVISDVPGDDISMVSSGPTVFDTTTKAQAERIAKRFGLPEFELVETPKDKKYFAKVENIMVASGSQTVDAMAKKARQLGYKPVVVSKQLSGLAKDVGPMLAARVKPGQVLLACGETEVVVSHPGKGGRNQDVALSALPHLSVDSVIISAASDGKDNIPVAGGIADGDWSRKMVAKYRIDVTKAVEYNQSYKILKRLRDHLQINKVTANISDFMLVLRGHDGD